MAEDEIRRIVDDAVAGAFSKMATQIILDVSALRSKGEQGPELFIPKVPKGPISNG